ncbi:helix-turn-helix domain-containing protein [Amycolatopsis thailandensis]|uniref:helix-turn-helix domain-containing protein n=1 Tax=Amycolatopsis thailandensis TaxID=589330 RepID=UPI00362D9D2D
MSSVSTVDQPLAYGIMVRVHELVSKVSALDPEAGNALRVVAHFDALVTDRAGLETVLQAAGAFTGCGVRLVEPLHGVDLRADENGQVSRGGAETAANWPGVPVFPGGADALWLERAGMGGVVNGIVLDRAAFVIREILSRTRGRTTTEDPAAVEVLLDHTTTESARRIAAARLHLPADGTARAVAAANGPGRIDHRPGAPAERWTGRGRVGIGPKAGILELPESWRQARLALRFAAENTEHDPGPEVVLAEELGTLAFLADAVPGPGTSPIPDVDALERVTSTAPWGLSTAVAFTCHASLRLTAAALFLHHSTLQDRICSLERELGWTIRDPQGRLRLQLAIATRRLLRHPASD